MKTLSITATKRESNGKVNTKALRKQGLVPCTLYGGKEQVFFSFEEKNFKNLIYTPDLHEVAFNIDGSEHRAVLQEIQYHPVTDKILHADFIELAEGKKISVNLPVRLTGRSIGVMEGGQMIQKLRKLKARGIPRNIPEFIEIAVDDLQTGSSIKVGDVVLEDLELLDSSNVVIVRVKAPRALKDLESSVETELEEGVEGEEGAEGAEGTEGAEGAEAKEGDKPAEGGEKPAE